jgi:nicotinamide-nucleotide amidase
MKAFVVTVGDEILIGQTIDTNSGWIGHELSLIGIKVVKGVSCADDHEEIIKSIREGMDQADLVILTGGLGPTKDDITKKAIADYFGVGMVFSEETFDRISRIFTKLGRQVTAGHRYQCEMPENAQLLRNSMGTAPGMLFRHQGKILLSMPGVPYEMKAIMREEVLPLLKKEQGLVAILHHTWITAGLGESEIAEKLENFENNLPPTVKLAYLPGLSQVRLRLTVLGSNPAESKQLMANQGAKLQEILGHHIFGTEGDTLEGALGQILLDRNLKLVTAESCTGGYMAHRLTLTPGASRYYQGTIVAYHNELKTAQLGVQSHWFETQGAVSEPVVLEMLRGVLDRMGADVGLSASGIAGPNGATPEKPVGTIWIAVGDRHHPRAIKLQLGKDRAKNIEMAAVQAINQLRLWLLDHPEVRG